MPVLINSLASDLVSSILFIYKFAQVKVLGEELSLFAFLTMKISKISNLERKNIRQRKIPLIQIRKNEFVRFYMKSKSPTRNKVLN